MLGDSEYCGLCPYRTVRGPCNAFAMPARAMMLTCERLCPSHETSKGVRGGVGVANVVDAFTSSYSIALAAAEHCQLC